VAEPSGTPPGPPHAARTTQAGEDTHHYRSTLRVYDACATLSATRAFHSVNTVGCSECTVRFFLFLMTLTFDLDLDIQSRKSKGPNTSSALQICSAVPVIRCRMRVPRIERVSTISRIWRTNGRQTITVNSGVSGPKFTKFYTL